MGWNDHVSMEWMECLECGQLDTWEIWDEVAKTRYGGDLGKKLGHDIKDAAHCPHCGSTHGISASEEEE